LTFLQLQAVVVVVFNAAAAAVQVVYYFKAVNHFTIQPTP
jgi:hypothetical protein